MSSTVAPPSLTITSVSSGSGLTTVTTINTAGQLQLQAQHGSVNSVVVPTVSVKQERHDEAEIQEMANKFREAQKAAMAKQTQQQQQVLMKQNSAALPGAVVAQANGQTNILSYLTRRSPQTVMGQAGAIPTAAIGSNGQVQSIGAVANGKPATMVTATAIGVPNTSIETNGDKKTCDEESQKGHFGWVTFGKIYIPYIVRQNEKYCAVRMVEMKLLNKYLSYLHPDIYSSCTCVRSYYITEAESRLLNEINHKHCDAQFGREMFTLKDLVVRLSDANKFYQFLDICYRKLVTGSKSPSDKCGFIRINKESVVPYTVRATEQVVPLFYFEGETDNLRQKAELLSGWDLAYLKFCCKVQGIRNELFSSESVAVISLTDIKSYFPTGTEFEDYWPSKVVDSNLLIASKNPNNSVHWTRQPTAPPVTPKILNALPKGVQQQQQQQQQQIRKNAYQTPVPQQNTLQSKRHTAATSMAILTGLPPTDPNIQAWSMAYAQGALRTGDTITQNDVRMIQNQQQQQVQRGYANVHNAAANAQNLQNLQNLMTARQQYNYNARGMPIPTIVNNCNQTAQPPPLVRSAVQQQQHVLHFSSGQHSPLERSDYQHYHNHQNLNIHLPGPPSMISPQPIDERSSAIYQLLSSPSASLSSCEPTNKTPTKSYLVDENRDSRYGHAMISSYPCDGPPGIAIPNVSPARASPKQFLRATPEQSKLPPPPLIPMPPMHSFTSGENKLPEAANVPTQEQLDVAVEKLKLIDGLSSFVRPSTISSFLSLLTNTQATSPSSTATNFLTYPYPDLLPTTPSKASSESVSLPTIRNIACNNPVTSAPASSTTMEVIDLSSPRRSTAAAAANVVMQQQQQQHQQQQRHQQQLQLQQQQQHQQQQQQQMQQRLNTMQNGRSNPPTTSNTMQRHATNAAMPGVADVSDVSLRVIPEITSQSTTGHVPYKVQKVFVFDDTLVPCINMKAYNDSDPLMTLMDFREYFFPNVSWQQCKRLLEALGVEMYRGNRRQTMTLIECGKNHNESIPLIQVRDVIKYMPQLRYMMRSSQIGQEQPPNKRTRIS